MTAEEIDNWQAAIRTEFDNEWSEAQAGTYLKSPKDFLTSNWQGEALKVWRLVLILIHQYWLMIWRLH